MFFSIAVSFSKCNDSLVFQFDKSARKLNKTNYETIRKSPTSINFVNLSQDILWMFVGFHGVIWAKEMCKIIFQRTCKITKCLTVSKTAL